MVYVPLCTNHTARRRAGWVSLVVGASIFVVKFVAYLGTGSTAILSDALESLVNIVAAAILIYSLRVSAKPPDSEHQYGHGKVDFLHATFEGGAVFVAALLIIAAAIGNLLANQQPQQLNRGLWLVIAAACVNAVLGIYLLKVGRTTRSPSLMADAKHVLTDVVTSGGVVVGLWLILVFKWGWLDSVVAIGFAVAILYTGWNILHKSISGMMDAADPASHAMIEAILQRPPEPDICSYHQLRHRMSGGFHFVDFHLQVPKKMTVERAHAIATAVENTVAQALGGAGVMAHIEPCEKTACPKCLGRI